MSVLFILGSVKVAEWPPFGKELLPRLTICSLRIMFTCCFRYFPFWFQGQDFGSDCASSWLLLTFYLTSVVPN